MSKQHRKNRQREREGVNAARTFFEAHDCVFQEVHLENDYGKGAYLDLGDARAASSVCAALQIKSGPSYRGANEYKIPLDEADFEYWSTSTVPMIGLVYDATDTLLRWVNITEYLDGVSGPRPTHIPVDPNAILTAEVLRGSFARSVARTVVGFRRHPLLQICDDIPEQQSRAISDCFALGRLDPRLLIGLRYFISRFDPQVLRHAIRALAHVTAHPDIFWTKENWIPEDRCEKVLANFRWSVEEIALLLSRVPLEAWTRGDSGQDLYMLLIEDPGLNEKLEKAAVLLLETDGQTAIHAVYLRVARAGKQGLPCLERLIAVMPSIRNDERVMFMQQCLRDHGFVGLW
ncbi:MAG: DUF4365 domain-containing protein [Fimbriimonadaceae bacterium]|nr:DUF4365 domain-containing protein [Fimbriimonadaceae bacterium]